MISVKDFTLLLDNYLNEFEDSDKVILTGGEPTYHPALKELIALCKERGKNPYLITNGGKLSDIDYFKDLIDAGLHTVQFSLHGSDEIIHDKITGTKGSFNNIIRAIENSKELQGIRFCTNSVINKLNYSDSESLINFLEDIIHPSSFLIASYFGELPSHENGKTVAINYKDVIPLFEQMMLQIEMKGLNGIFITSFPWCLTEKSIFNPRTTCSACNSSIQFLPDGYLIPCPALSGSNYRVRIKDHNSFNNAKAEVKERFTFTYNRLLSEECKSCENLKGCKSACFIKNRNEIEDIDFSTRIKEYVLNNRMPVSKLVLRELNYSLISKNNDIYQRIQIDLNKDIGRDDISDVLTQISNKYPTLELDYFYPPKVVVYEQQDEGAFDISHSLAQNLWKKVLSTDITQFVDYGSLFNILENLDFKEVVL
jgi:radical SAM protein with 4Fe4S-binding SPASM domain